MSPNNDLWSHYRIPQVVSEPPKGLYTRLNKDQNLLIHQNQVVMSANDNFSLHDDEELSLHDDASLDGMDDDTWAMEMEHYLEYMIMRVLPPATQEEQFADEKERKARTLLLMAVPKDHLRRFHGMDDAKEIWAAIKTREEEITTYPCFLANADDVDLIHEDLDQIDDLDLEEMDINWQIAMTAIKIKKFYKKTGRRPRVDGKMHVAFDKRKKSIVPIAIILGTFCKGVQEALFESPFIIAQPVTSIKPPGSVARTTALERSSNPHDSLMRIYTPRVLLSIHVLNCGLIHIMSFKAIDGELGAVSDHSVNDDPIHDHIPIPSIEQVTIATQKTQPQVPKPQQTVDPSCAQHVKTPRQPIRTPVTPSPIPSYNRQNWNQRMERDLGAGYSFERKPCFVCGSLSHLIKDCDYYEKKMAREAALKSKRVVHADMVHKEDPRTVKGTGAHLEAYQETIQKWDLVTFGKEVKVGISGKGTIRLGNRVRGLPSKSLNIDHIVLLVRRESNTRPLVQMRVMILMCQTKEAADLMVVSSTSLTEATRKAAKKELDDLALKHLGQYCLQYPTSTNPVNTGSDNLNTVFEEVTPGTRRLEMGVSCQKQSKAGSSRSRQEGRDGLDEGFASCIQVKQRTSEESFISQDSMYELRYCQEICSLNVKAVIAAILSMEDQVCVCSHFSNAKTSHLNAVKRLFKLSQGANQTWAYGQSTTGGCQFLGQWTFSWHDPNLIEDSSPLLQSCYEKKTQLSVEKIQRLKCC
ncbi:hypothetical protein Tco_0551586 [Tanacetum coccineum]